MSAAGAPRLPERLWGPTARELDPRLPRGPQCCRWGRGAGRDAERDHVCGRQEPPCGARAALGHVSDGTAGPTCGVEGARAPPTPAPPPPASSRARASGPLSPRRSSSDDPPEPSHGAGPGPERLIRVPSACPPSPDWRRLRWLRADGPARDGRALSSEGAGQARGPSHPWGNRTKKAKKMQKAQEDVSRRGSGQPRSWGPGRAAGVRPMRLQPRRPRAAFVLGKPSRAPHPGAHSRRAETPAVAARGTAWPLAKAGS